jgi:hypothetical protein
MRFFINRMSKFNVSEFGAVISALLGAGILGLFGKTGG